MKVLVLYRPNSDHGRIVEDFIQAYRSTGPSVKLEAHNIDSREGSSLAMLYDVVRYPAVLALKDDGGLQQLWEGDELPRVDEVRSYVTS